MPRGKSTGTTRRKLDAQPSQTQKTARRSGVSKKRSKKAPVAELPAAPTPAISTLEPVTTSVELDFDVNSVQNYEQLMAALQAKKVQITLGNNIIAPENILINYDVAINLNGFSIISEESVEAARVLDIRSGAVTLTGQGKIFAMGPRSVAIRVFGAISAENSNYTTLTIDEGISIFAPDAYGILISPNLGAAYGLTINMAGQIFAHEGVCIASGVTSRETNLPLVNLQNSASIIADETTGAALEAAGYGRWQIGTAWLRGATGASLRNGILEFTNTQVLANSGAVFQLEDAAEPTLEVTVNGGNYVAEQNTIFSGTSVAVKKFILKSGEFYGQTAELPAELKSIVEVKKSATLRTDVAEFLENITEQARLAQETTTLVSETVPEGTTEPETIALAPESTTETKTTTPAPENTVAPETTSTPPEDTERELSDDELIELAFAEAYEDSKPKKAKRHTTKTRKPASKTSKVVTPVQTFAEQIDHLPELTDFETDEETIVSALTSEKAEPTQPIFAPPAPIQPVAEQDAARLALADAISDIRKLSAEDYDVGFSELERALQDAETVLSDPLAELANIRDAASNLLLAFDGLEEHDEFSLSDAELDELFYHGAVLGELVAPAEKKTARRTPKPETTPLDYQDLPNTPSLDDKTADFEPDFSVLSDVLNTISELKLENYSEQSRLELIQVLDQAQTVLTDLHSPQSAIDEISTNLVAMIAKLEPLRALRSPTPNVHMRGLAPTVNAIMPAAMLDEMTPSATWTQGIVMIDEMEPFVADATTKQKMLRAMKPWIVGMAELAAEPLQRIRRGLKAGWRAGLNAYRETLNRSF